MLRLTASELARLQRGQAPAVGKYRAKPQIVDGIRFASRLEARRYTQLKALRISGEIRWFIRQPRFDLPGGIRYVADFLVVWPRLQYDETIVEDAKGMRTPEYILKRKLMLATHGIRIVEISSKAR